MGGFAQLARHRRQTAQLGRVIHNDTSHAVVQCHFQLVHRFVVAVEIDAVGRKIHLHRGVQFAARHHIDAAAFLFDDAVHLLEAARLAGVRHHTALRVAIVDRLLIIPQRLTDGGFVHHIQGSAVLRRQFHGITAADGQMSRGVDRRVVHHRHD